MYRQQLDPAVLQGAVSELDVGKDECLVLFVGERAAPALHEVVTALSELGVAFMGGLFPAVIADQQVHAGGFVALKMPLQAPVRVVPGLSEESFALPEHGPMVPSGGGTSTALVLVDGLARHLSGFLTGLREQLGPSVRYVGGGAGSIRHEPQPCLFSNEGVFQDAALVALSPWHCQLGVRHGWSPLAGPFSVTRSHDNVLEELNWTRAYDVYGEAVRQDCGTAPEGQRFSELAKQYPFGILADDRDDVVRDPLRVDAQGGLVCVGEVPEHATLSILKGSPDALLKAAIRAARDALPDDPARSQASLLMDCASRALYLEGRFDEELRAIALELARAGVLGPPLGALTLGEIASPSDGSVEFFNKTAVVGVLHDGP